jgi:phospholipase/carboxylesterase
MSMPLPLHFEERPADGDARGLLVLHHGRGSDERDLIGLADALDPQRDLHVVAPRAPMQIHGMPGYHWYAVPRVGYPDTETFATAYASLADFHDMLWKRTGLTPAQTVLGGFSMGAVMSHACGWGSGRPVVAGVLGFSGFIPIVDGWSADFAAHAATRAFVSHGALDPVIGVEFARAVRDQLEAAGIDLEYAEFAGEHWIEPAHAARATSWIADVLQLREQPADRA